MHIRMSHEHRRGVRGWVAEVECVRCTDTVVTLVDVAYTTRMYVVTCWRHFKHCTPQLANSEVQCARVDGGLKEDTGRLAPDDSSGTSVKHKHALA